MTAEELIHLRDLAAERQLNDLINQLYGLTEEKIPNGIDILVLMHLPAIGMAGYQYQMPTASL